MPGSSSAVGPPFFLITTGVALLRLVERGEPGALQEALQSLIR